MEELIAEIEAYAAVANRPPQAVIRKICGYGGGVWHSWKAGRSSPTMINVDRMRAWMRANPPENFSKDAA
ncbi:hypothetical protein [Nioella sp.]|uniref:hypothetical protein n=1 Tax=Nioella sp. TaxID=1912091 RepID=UPI0035189148